jgi:hypothetical protein
MEKESFEDVANMNVILFASKSIAKSVRRGSYMTAAQLLTGSGGLECTGLSRWKTIFAGTFLKKTGSKCYIIL